MYKVTSTKGEIYFVTKNNNETYGFCLRGKEVLPVTGDAHGFEYEATKDAIDKYRASHS